MRDTKFDHLVTMDPDIRRGEPCIRSTRFPVAQPIAQLEFDTLDGVISDFDPQTVVAAIHWSCYQIKQIRNDI